MLTIPSLSGLDWTNVSDITQFIILIEYCLMKVSTDERVELIEM